MKLFFILIIIFNILFASDNITTILAEIEKNQDLSVKTKQESSGISYVITRYQLDMMQAKYLRDVLKNTIIGYEVSRYGVLDPWRANNLPYSSNGIRVFIDNQEITTAQFDNGLFLLGNINLSFVDHIEIYYLNPSYAISTEPAYIIIKLYSKSPQKDEGKRISLTYGSFGSNSENFDIADAKSNYYMHISRSRVKHPRTWIDNTPISRDNLNTHFLWTYRHNNTNFLLNAIYQDQNPFMGISWDGKLQDGKQLYKEAHFGIEHKVNNWKLEYACDYLKNDVYYYEDSGLFIKSIPTAPYYVTVKEIDTRGYGLVNTLKANYYLNYKQHKVIAGVNFRNKRIDYSKIEVDGVDQNYNGIQSQTILSGYLEDNIQTQKNLVFTFGYKFGKYFNDIMADYNLHQYKANATYLYDKNNIYKISYQHLEYSIPIYLYNNLYSSTFLKPQKMDALIAKYKKDFKKFDMEFVGFYGLNKNYPVMQNDGTLVSNDKNIYIKYLSLRFHKNYNIINDFVAEYLYLKAENVPLNRSYILFVLNTHRYKKFDFFENVIYKNNEFKYNGIKYIKDGVDLSLGVKFNYSDDLSFALKGENLLGQTYENSYMRIVNFDPTNIESVNVQLIDRKVLFTMEYWF